MNCTTRVYRIFKDNGLSIQDGQWLFAHIRDGGSMDFASEEDIPVDLLSKGLVKISPIETDKAVVELFQAMAGGANPTFMELTPKGFEIYKQIVKVIAH